MTVEAGTFRTRRTLPAPPAQVYGAFAAADQLAAWWGPDGFRNEFSRCEFKAGGAWSFVMIGPDGARYKNESTFVELVADARVVIQHESAPRFRLTVEMLPAAGGTLLTWTQAFEDPGVAAAIRHIVEAANEQNLDRLSALLAGGGAAG